MKKRVERYIPLAIAGVKAEFGPAPYKIPTEFQGYISSMGASILQMGLVPTLAVFADKDSGAARERRRLLTILAKILYADPNFSDRKRLENQDDQVLFQLACAHVGNKNKIQTLKQFVLDAGVAVKLGIRTFKLVKTSENNDE